MKTWFGWLALALVVTSPSAVAQGGLSDGPRGDSVSTPAANPPVDTADTSAGKRASLVVSTGYSNETFGATIGGGMQTGLYSLEFFLPVTVLASDPYNEGKTNISWSAAVTVGVIQAVSVFHYQDVGGMRNVLNYAIVLPVVLLNSQHHLLLVGAKGLFESTGLRITAFLGSRTDLYSKTITWVRWTPVAGAQLAIRSTGGSEPGGAQWLALSGGIETPVDFSSGAHALPSRWFAGVKYYFPFNPD